MKLQSPKLPFWRTVGQSFWVVGANFDQFLRISWFWTLILVPLFFGRYWLLWKKPAAAGILPSLIELPILASVAVAWHRLLLKEKRQSAGWYAKLDGATLRYAAVSFGLSLFWNAPFWLLVPIFRASASGDPSVASVLALFAMAGSALVLGLVTSRISLVLPALAIGQPLSLAQSWQITRGNSWTLMLTSCCCLIPATVVTFATLEVLPELLRPTRLASSMRDTIISLYSAITLVVLVSQMSIAYAHFVEQREIGTSDADQT
jgi:hypothetical protein